MKWNWSFFATPEFLVGALVCGLALNVLGAYVVRGLDHVRSRLPAHYRAVREKELGRIKQLSAAATSDYGLYAALAAEAGRLRLHQLLGFFNAFVCVCGMMLLIGALEMDGSAGVRPTITARIAVMIAVVFLLPMAGFQFTSGLENGSRARRLDTALREVHKSRELPIMD